MANKQSSPPLTEKEIRGIYRNEFYTVNNSEYFGKTDRNKKKNTYYYHYGGRVKRNLW